MVNEPSVFEPSKFYCTYFPTKTCCDLSDRDSSNERSQHTLSGPDLLSANTNRHSMLKTMDKLLKFGCHFDKGDNLKYIVVTSLVSQSIFSPGLERDKR